MIHSSDNISFLILGPFNQELVLTFFKSDTHFVDEFLETLPALCFADAKIWAFSDPTCSADLEGNQTQTVFGSKGCNEEI